VCVPHRAVINLVGNSDYLELGAEDVVAQVSHCCFDASVFEIWGALLNGSRLVGMSREDVLSAERFSGQLARHGVTTVLLTTALFNELVRERPGIFGSLRCVLFGGEECDGDAVRQVLQSTPPQRLFNVYGPTETTTFATWYEIKGEAESCPWRVPIGRPLANTQVYILDQHLEAVPIGVAGEICVGGKGVSLGYLQDPELSAERFIASPFVPGGRLYRTGDRGRFQADGNIEFLGRIDQQVKIRGFRIEPGEVESVLLGHAGVRQAAVCVRERSGGGNDKSLVGYVVTEQEGSAAQIEQELRAFLKGKLPDYMVPAAFVLLEKLPLTSTGKIDRCALPAPIFEKEKVDSIGPRSETEKMVAEAWSAVMDGESIGIYEDFFQLGGHSLLAMRVISRLRSASGLDIPLRVFFENATVAALAEYIDGARCSGAKTPLAPLAVDHEELVL
jgi:acyl-CoA synthetase (AMP-forming)/AMP-acid ligase II